MRWADIEANWDRIWPITRDHFGLPADATPSSDQRTLTSQVAENYGISEQEAAQQVQEWALRLESQEGDASGSDAPASS